MPGIERIKGFLGEVHVESKKVTWPSRAELYESTWVVLVAVLIITGFIWLVDIGLNGLVRIVM